MNTLASDIRLAVRMWKKWPALTFIAALTLALGIGANTALFSVVNGVLLNPLPYPQSGQLIAVYGRYGRDRGSDKETISYLNFLDWQRDSKLFSSMAVYRNQDYLLTGTDEGERLSGYMISAEFFSTLGVNPILGRALRADDDQPGASSVAVISGGFWKRKFGSSPEVIGKSITLNGSLYEIIGVVPASFTFYGNSRDVYAPIGQWRDPSFRDRRISVSARAFGRLLPGVTLEQSRAEMDAIARNLEAAYPEADKDLGITLLTIKEDIVGNIQPLLLVLQAAVGFLLLIACANVASLVFARSIGRSREFAVRAALGASRTRIVRQLLTESVLLAGLGGVLGLLFAFWGTRALLGVMPATVPRTTEVHIDARVLLFTLAVSFLSGIAFGLTPALKSSQVSLQQTMNEGGRGTSGARHRAHGMFVASEIAMTLILLVGAGLMLRTLGALWRVNPGFNPSHAITFSVSLPSTPNTSAAETRARLRAFDDKMLSLPGVQAASVTLGSRPMIHDSSLPFWIEGEPKPAHDNDMHPAIFYLAEAGFQQAMGITLERGRFITPQDDERAPKVIDIDDVFARTYFPNQDPLGKRVNLEQFDVQAEIVGVVGHVKQWGPGADEKSTIEAQFFYPFMQLPEKLMPLVANGVAVVVRTNGDPAAIMGQVRAAIREIDPREVIYNVQTMEDLWSSSMAARTFSMILFALFAALALAVACVGLYGVISYFVSQRTQEIGVRMALGAQRRDILNLILSHGAKMTTVGALVGIAASLVLTRLMASQLFGVSSYDPVTFASVALLLMLVGLAACWIPARRAMRVDPMVALRYE
jgi:predicted permease